MRFLSPSLRIWLALSALVAALSTIAIVWTSVHWESRSYATGIKNAAFTAVSEDGRWVAQADNKGRIVVLETQTGATRQFDVGPIRGLLIAAPREADLRAAVDVSDLSGEAISLPMPAHWKSALVMYVRADGALLGEYVGSFERTSTVFVVSRVPDEPAFDLSGLVASTRVNGRYLREVTCVATAIYLEAGRESAVGQKAVAEVILARTRVPGRPKSACGVVYEGSRRPTGCQFSFACDGAPDAVADEAAWSRAHVIAESVLSKESGTWRDEGRFGISIVVAAPLAHRTWTFRWMPQETRGAPVVTSASTGSAIVTAVAGLDKDRWLLGTADGRVVSDVSKAGAPTPVPPSTAVRKLIVTGKSRATLEPLYQLAGRSDVVFSPDGTKVATGSLNGVRIWDAASGELSKGISVGPSVAGASLVAFSPNGRQVLAVTFDVARLWEAASGKVIAVLRGHRDAIDTAAFSPDGTRIVTASNDDTARLWRASDGRQIAVMSHTDLVTRVSFSRDGTRILTASWDHTARLWNGMTGAPIAVLQGHKGELVTGVFSPDGTRVATTSVDGTARLWDGSNGTQVAVLPGGVGGILAGAFSADGNQFTATSSNGIAVWDAQTQAMICKSEDGRFDPLVQPAFSPSGTWIAAVGMGAVGLWDARTCNLLASAPIKGTITRVAVAQTDAVRLAIAAQGGAIDMDTNDVTIFRVVPAGESFVAVLEDGRDVRGAVSDAGEVSLAATGQANEALSLRGRRMGDGWGRSLDGRPIVDGARVTLDTPVGTIFEDCAECPQMVVVPAGAFRMGSPSSEAGREAGEVEHDAKLLRPFAVGAFEITRAQWEAMNMPADNRAAGCIGESSGETGPFRRPQSPEDAARELQGRSLRSWRDPGFAQTDLHPVTCVNWSDAKTYLNSLSVRTGKKYRLLSETEWEYVARAGVPPSRALTIEPPCGYANTREDGTCSDGFTNTSPSGRMPRNAFGLYDTLGNVWEWVEDCWISAYPPTAPADGQAQRGGSCSDRVLRGGSWDDDGMPHARAARRVGRGLNERRYDAGLRVARDL